MSVDVIVVERDEHGNRVSEYVYATKHDMDDAHECARHIVQNEGKSFRFQITEKN